MYIFLKSNLQITTNLKIYNFSIFKGICHIYCRLFEAHPDVQDVFMPFKGLTKDDLQHSNQLRSHALRVMGTVEKCLARIDEPKKLEQVLSDLGSRHVMYNAKVDYIDVS